MDQASQGKFSGIFCSDPEQMPNLLHSVQGTEINVWNIQSIFSLKFLGLDVL